MNMESGILRHRPKALTPDQQVDRNKVAITQSRRRLVSNWFKNMKINLDTIRDKYCLLQAKISEKVVIVGACPSLDGQLDQLMEYQAMGYQVVCADRALASIKHLVDPDYIITIEDSNLINGFIDGYDTSKSKLLAALRVSPEFLNKFKGQAFFFISRPADKMDELEMMNYAQHLQLPYVDEYGHVCAAAYVICKKMGAKDIKFLGNDYYFYGQEVYSRAMKDHCIKITQYYSRPIPNKKEIYWKKKDEKKIFVARDCRHIYQTYPKSLNGTRPGQVGKYTNAMFQFLKQRMANAMEEN